MKTIETIVYEFNELSKEAKQKAIDNWYEHEDYPFLEDEIYCEFEELAKKHGIEYSDIKLYYSLGCCQGDGLCFVGTIRKDGIDMYIKHTGRYYNERSTERTCCNEDGDYCDSEQLEKIYFDICQKLEKYGYSIIDYRMDEDEFNDLCVSNEYTFLPNGTMKNY